MKITNKLSSLRYFHSNIILCFFKILPGLMFSNNLHGKGIMNCPMNDTLKSKFESSSPIHQYSIDFNACKPKHEHIGLGLGSSVYRVIGKMGLTCILETGGEIENPSWNGALPIKCAVPVEVGISQFKPDYSGIKFTDSQRYCSTKPPEIVVNFIKANDNAEQILALKSNDRDCDGIDDYIDNCVNIPNPTQKKTLDSTLGDACFKPKIVMPNLKKLSLDNARKEISKLGLIEGVQVDQDSPKGKTGTFIENQFPSPGTKIGKGASVNFVLTHIACGDGECDFNETKLDCPIDCTKRGKLKVHYRPFSDPNTDNNPTHGSDKNCLSRFGATYLYTWEQLNECFRYWWSKYYGLRSIEEVTENADQILFDTEELEVGKCINIYYKSHSDPRIPFDNSCAFKWAKKFHSRAYCDHLVFDQVGVNSRHKCLKEIGFN